MTDASRPSAKQAGGVFERLELLHRHGLDVTDPGDAAAVPIDDLLDAAACAWTAQRIEAGIADSLPDPPQVIDGRRVAIWR